MRTKKIKAALALPWPSSVMVPVIPTEEVKENTPGVRTMPPKSNPVRSLVIGRAVRAAYAACASAWPAAHMEPAVRVPDEAIAGGNPVIEVPTYQRMKE